MPHLVPLPRRSPERAPQMRGMIVPSERYGALFETALSHLPGARHAPLRDWRAASFERFRALGFPGPKVEAWKYTSVRPLAREDYALAAAVPVRRADLVPYLLEQPNALRLVFVNGQFAAELSDDLSDLPGRPVQSLAAALETGEVSPFELGLESSSERAFSALNAAFAADGCVIRLDDGARLAGPVQLLFVSLGDDHPTLISPRNLIALGAGARLDLIESHVTMGHGRPLTNLVNRFVVGGRAELNHDRLQLGELAGSLIGKTHYRISADARLTQSLATLGGAFVRNEIEAVLDGSGIELGLNGLYLGRERQHIDNAIQVEHARPGSTSNQFYKGVLDGRAQAAFAGRIVVQRDAQKTNAYQANNNLLLSADAEVDTKPELEIFADDVKCSHGATAGELDERALFYLRSRGIEPATARSLLTYAFADEVLERFHHPAVAAQARRELLRWLPGGAELEGLL
jgi:Fe-S cluster assembly protein SufD